MMKVLTTSLGKTLSDLISITLGLRPRDNITRVNLLPVHQLLLVVVKPYSSKDTNSHLYASKCYLRAYIIITTTTTECMTFNWLVVDLRERVEVGDDFCGMQIKIIARHIYSLSTIFAAWLSRLTWVVGVYIEVYGKLEKLWPTSPLASL